MCDLLGQPGEDILVVLILIEVEFTEDIRKVVQNRLRDSQGDAFKLFGCDDWLIGAERLSSRPNLGEPHHDFEACFRRVHGLGLVWVQEHIEGDVGVDRVLLELIKISRRRRVVADTIGPLHIDVDGSYGLEHGREHAAVHLDVREGMDRQIALSLRVVPRA